MGSRPLEPTLLLAWPTTEFGGMGLEGAVNIIHRKELEAIADADARAAFHREKTDALKRANTALSAAARFDVDDVIDPADTRRLLAQTLARLPQPPTAHRPQAPGRPVLGSVCRSEPGLSVVSTQSQLLHTFQLDCVGPNARPENIVSQRKHNIEILVLVSVMQPVMSCQKPIDRPGAEDPLFRLVHLEMNFVPCPVVKTHNSHEDGCSLPGHQSNDRSKGKSLYRRLPHGQAYLLVFTSRHRLITEYLGVVLMMHNGVGLKYSLESCSIPTEVVSSVHQPPVHLVLDEGHQNARDNEPADDLQTKHHISKGNRSSNSARLGALERRSPQEP
jgi:Carboxyl transferase domain